MIKGLVSVIIPNHNRNINELLESLNNSSYKNIEILEINLGFERSKQRNIGIDRAKGEYFLFLDSDQAVSPDLIFECMYLCDERVHFQHTLFPPDPPGGILLLSFNKSDAVYIPEIIKTKGLFAYIRNWERQFYNGTPVDVVRFVRASHCPRFDENLNGPEDSDWDWRVSDGGRRIISHAPLYHYDDVSFFTYFKKKVYYAESMAKYAKKWPQDKVLDWRWRCFGVFLENSKWKRFLSRPDLALAVLGIILIRGVIYLWKR